MIAAPDLDAPEARHHLVPGRHLEGDDFDRVGAKGLERDIGGRRRRRVAARGRMKDDGFEVAAAFAAPLTTARRPKIRPGTSAMRRSQPMCRYPRGNAIALGVRRGTGDLVDAEVQHLGQCSLRGRSRTRTECRGEPAGVDPAVAVDGDGAVGRGACPRHDGPGRSGQRRQRQQAARGPSEVHH